MPVGVYQRTSPNTTRARLADLKIHQGQPATEKLILTRQVIEHAIAHEPACLMVSGGRDSTVLADIMGRYYGAANVLLMHNDTGMATDSHLERIREMGAASPFEYIETQAPPLMDVWRKRGHWPLLGKRTHSEAKRRTPGLKASPVQCCYWHKEKPAREIWRERKVGVILWGNRAAESMRRRMAWVDSGFLFAPKKKDWRMAYPIAHWLNQDIDTYLRRYVPDYKQATSTESGCRLCATDIKHWPNNMGRLFVSNRPEWERYMLAGIGEQIARLNNLDTNKVPEIVANAPELLLRVKWRAGHNRA